MQLAIRSTFTAGVALASAAVIAVSPISPVAPRLADATVSAIHTSSAAVELTALTDPITAWMEVFGTTFNNIAHIGGSIAAAPFPILQQVIANQVANGQLLFSSIDAAAMSYIRFFTSAEDYQGAYWLREAAKNLLAGNISGSAANVSAILFRLFAFANPLINIMQIPIGISQNLVNVFAAVPQLLMPLGLSVLNPIEGAINASGDIAQGVLDAIKAGDPVGALGAVINAPAVLAGAILNGYYNDLAGLTTGLFTTGASILNRGLIQTLLVTIPQAIATAIGWHAPTAARELSANVVEEAPAVEADAETGVAEVLPAVEHAAVSSISDTSAAVANAVKALTASFSPQSEAAGTPTASEPSEVDGAGGEAGTVIEEEAPATETPASDGTDVVDSTDETTGSTDSEDATDPTGSEESNGSKTSPNGSTDLSGGNKAVPGKTGTSTNAGTGSGSASTDESASPTTSSASGTGSTSNNVGTGSDTNGSGNDAGGSNDGSDGGSDS